MLTSTYNIVGEGCKIDWPNQCADNIKDKNNCEEI